jgi:hypothetical protein
MTSKGCLKRLKNYDFLAVGQGSGKRTVLSETGRKWISLIFPLAILAVVMIFFRPFLTGDDVCFNLMLSGTVGDGRPCEMLINPNVLLGLFLKIFYLWAPGFPWYTTFLYCALLFSAWSLFCCLLPLKGDLFRTSVVAGVLCLIFFHCFLHPLFTSIAFMCGAAGIIALIEHIRNAKCTGGYFLPAGLMFVSYLIRIESFLGMLLAAAPFLVFQLVERGVDRKKAVSFAFRTGLVILGATAFHWAYYQVSPGWSGVHSYLTRFSRVADNRLVERTPEMEQSLKNLGLDWTDYQMIRYWLFFDPKFDYGKLEALGRVLPSPARGKGMGWLAIFQMQYVQVLMLAVALCLIGLSNSMRLMLLVLLAWILALLVGLFYFARLPGEHVVVPLFSFFALAGLFCLSGESAAKRHRSNMFFRITGLIGLALWLMAVIPFLGFERKQNNFIRGMEAEISLSLQELKTTPNQLFVASTMCFPFEATGAFGKNILDRNFSVYPLCWNQATPWGVETLRRFGINNLILDTVGRKDVFFILPDYLWPLYLDFARNNYGLELKPVPVFQGSYFQVNRVEKVKEK